MPAKFLHTNIISKDCKKLANFYVQVFGCKQTSPESNLSGSWLEKGTGVKNAALRSIDLKLPGYEGESPTLEIFQYNESVEKPSPVAANREGYGHIAFEVVDVESILEKMVSFGGEKLGEVVSKEFKSGTLTFTYATDPEGNIIELSKWEPK